MKAAQKICLAILCAGVCLGSSAGAEDAGERVKNDIPRRMRQMMADGPRFKLVGEISEARTNGTFVINGEEFALSPQARVYGQLKKGATAAVQGTAAGDRKLATLVEVGEGSSAPAAASGGAVQ